MSPEALCLLVGACCAACSAAPCYMWARQEQKRIEAELDLKLAREELVQSRRTIQSLHKQMGLTETHYAPWETLSGLKKSRH